MLMSDVKLNINWKVTWWKKSESPTIEHYLGKTAGPVFTTMDECQGAINTFPQVDKFFNPWVYQVSPTDEEVTHKFEDNKVIEF